MKIWITVQYRHWKDTKRTGTHNHLLHRYYTYRYSKIIVIIRIIKRTGNRLSKNYFVIKGTGTYKYY